MKKILLLSITLFATHFFGQNKETPFISRSSNETGITVSTNGDVSATGLSFKQDWGIGKNKKNFKIGVGIRVTSSFGNNKLQYTTAPARLTTNTSGPGVLFADQITKNIDSLSVNATQVNALNLFLSLRYDISQKWGAEFNIDFAGISFGGKQNSVLLYGEKSNNTQTSIAKPSTTNFLLLGDNDLGSLNSEFMATYSIKPNLRLKSGVVFLFNEYKLDNPVSYTNSIGTTVDATTYRAKLLMFGIGINYVFNNK